MRWAHARTRDRVIEEVLEHRRALTKHRIVWEHARWYPKLLEGGYSAHECRYAPHSVTKKAVGSMVAVAEVVTPLVLSHLEKRGHHLEVEAEQWSSGPPPLGC